MNTLGEAHMYHQDAALNAGEHSADGQPQDCRPASLCEARAPGGHRSDSSAI